MSIMWSGKCSASNSSIPSLALSTVVSCDRKSSQAQLINLKTQPKCCLKWAELGPDLANVLVSRDQNFYVGREGMDI